MASKRERTVVIVARPFDKQAPAWIDAYTACVCPIVCETSVLDPARLILQVHTNRPTWAPYATQPHPQDLTRVPPLVLHRPPVCDRVTMIEQITFDWPQQGFSVVTLNVYSLPALAMWSDMCTIEPLTLAGCTFVYTDAFVRLNAAHPPHLAAQFCGALKEGTMRAAAPVLDDATVQLPRVDPVVWPRNGSVFIPDALHPVTAFACTPVPRGDACLIEVRSTTTAFVWAEGRLVAMHRSPGAPQGIYHATFHRATYYVTHLWAQDAGVWRLYPATLPDVTLDRAHVVTVRSFMVDLYSVSSDGRPGYWDYQAHAGLDAVPHDRLLVVPADGRPHMWIASRECGARRFLTRYTVKTRNTVDLKWAGDVGGKVESLFTVRMDATQWLPERGWASFSLSSHGPSDVQWNHQADPEWVTSGCQYSYHIIPASIGEQHREDAWMLGILCGRRTYVHHVVRHAMTGVAQWSCGVAPPISQQFIEYMTAGQCMRVKVAWDVATREWKTLSTEHVPLSEATSTVLGWAAALDVVAHMDGMYRTTMLTLACEARRRMGGASQFASASSYSPLHDCFLVTSPDCLMD